MVVFLAGERPIFGTQILYFLDPVFSSARDDRAAGRRARHRREPKLFQAVS